MESTLSSYFPVLVLTVLALTIAIVFVVLSRLLGKNVYSKTKLQPYECGLNAASSPRRRFAVHFFLVAMLFLLFDVEVAFLFPWAILVKTFKAAGMGTFIVVEGLMFVGILTMGLVYVWKRGALNWER